MIYVESFLISALIFVGGYCTFFDIKKGIIPNIVIFIGTVGALIGNVILFMLSGVEQLPIFLLHIVSASVIAVLMYLLRIWAGGDVKLFVLLSALTPVECLKHRIPLPAIMIFIGAFSFTFLFLVVQSVVFLIKKEKTYQVTQKIKLIPFVSCVAFTMAVQAVIRFAFKAIYSEYIGVFMFLNVVLVLLFGKMKFLHNVICIIICSVICTADIILFVLNHTAAIDVRPLLIVLLVIALRFFAGRYNYREIKTKDVKAGMVLSYATVFRFTQSRVKGLPQTTSENMSSRISQEEAESIIRWADSKYGQETIVILRKIPFAVFITTGYIAYIVIGFLW